MFFSLYSVDLKKKRGSRKIEKRQMRKKIGDREKGQ